MVTGYTEAIWNMGKLHAEEVSSLDLDWYSSLSVCSFTLLGVNYFILVHYRETESETMTALENYLESVLMTIRCHHSQ